MADRDSPSSLSGVHSTALAAAVARARHLIVDSDPKIFRDDFALPLCGLGESDVLDMNKFPLPRSNAPWVLRARYTEDRRDNFDIYLPEWLARHNRLICGARYACGVLATALLWHLRRA